MRYQQDLQLAIQEWFRRLLTAYYEDFGHQLDLTTEWISKQSALMAILTAAERVEPDPNYEQWAGK